MQTVSNYLNKVELEFGGVNYVGSGYRALHLIRALMGYTQKLQVVIKRGRVASSVGCGVWCRRRWVHPVSSQFVSQRLVKMPQMPHMLWLRGLGDSAVMGVRWVRSKGVGRCLG